MNPNAFNRKPIYQLGEAEFRRAQFALSKVNALLFLLFISLANYSCNAQHSKSERIMGYNLSKPDLLIVMPDTLREISGLALLDSATFACIQDENGILFIYDLYENEIDQQYSFHMDGDYEGITRVGKTLYVLRSDGTLFEINPYDSPRSEIKSYITGIPADNNEGLCYDSKNNRLLIACKGKIGKGSAFKDKRVIYGFDLEEKKLSSEPIYDFDLKAVKDFAESQKLDIPLKTKKKKGETKPEPLIKLRPSAICIHPLTHQLFVLSASDNLLFIFQTDGTLDHIERLNPDIFYKPEGVSFFDNGDMLISNEAKGKKPTVLKFNYNVEN